MVKTNKFADAFKDHTPVIHIGSEIVETRYAIYADPYCLMTLDNKDTGEDCHHVAKVGENKVLFTGDLKKCERRARLLLLAESQNVAAKLVNKSVAYSIYKRGETEWKLGKIKSVHIIKIRGRFSIDKYILKINVCDTKGKPVYANRVRFIKDHNIPAFLKMSRQLYDIEKASRKLDKKLESLLGEHAETVR